MSLEKAVKAVTGSYPDLNNKSEISSYALWSDDGQSYTNYLLAACHHAMANIWGGKVDASKYDHLITAYTCEHPLAITFFNFLRDHLFKEWQDQIFLERSSDGFPYIRVANLDKIPAQVVYNFCIWSRIPLEFRAELKAWGKLIDAGVHPGFAAAVMQCPVYDGKVIGLVTNGSSNHWPTYNTLDLRLLVLGTPKHHGLMYKANPGACTPCNMIWGDTQVLKPLVGQTILDFWNTWKEQNADLLLAS